MCGLSNRAFRKAFRERKYDLHPHHSLWSFQHLSRCMCEAHHFDSRLESQNDSLQPDKQLAHTHVDQGRISIFLISAEHKRSEYCYLEVIFSFFEKSLASNVWLVEP